MNNEKSQHTPGPWCRDSVSGNTAIIRDVKGRIVATIGSGSEYARSHMEANACLVMAAPELLETLKRCIIALEKDGQAAACAVLNTSGRAAIAKAGGQVMSTPVNDGGPAFPTQYDVRDSSSAAFHTDDGMTLRDYFAAHASEEDIDGFLSVTYNGPEDRLIAKYAYADAMLKARKNPTP